MSLFVALRSVTFYLVACSPCAKANHRRKAKQQARKEKEERKLETEQPGLYRHPSPFSTNPFWNEEIMLGPGPPKRKGGRNGNKNCSKNGSSRRLNTAGQGSSAVSGTTSTDAGSSPTMVAADQRLSGEDWNPKRFQREDEELWGQKATHHARQKFKDALVRATSSVGISDRLLGGRLTKTGTSYGEEEEEEEEEEIGTYYIARNPPVNDLHPPIVSSQPTHKGGTSWMLQPPPPAKVMEGKELANISRSDSGASSSRKAVDDMNLGRQVSSRFVEARLGKGKMPVGDPSSLSSADPISKPKVAATRTRDRQDKRRDSSSDSSSFSEGAIKRKRRPPPISVPPSRKTKEKAEHIPIPTKPSEISTNFRLAPGSKEKEPSSRPVLATITSSSMSVPQAGRSADIEDSQPLQPRDNSTSNNSTNQSSEPLQRTSKDFPAVAPKVYHSFQGKETFVFPPKRTDPQRKENERVDYDADWEDEDSRETLEV